MLEGKSECDLYAPDLHSSMKQVQKVRRELRLRTMFNLLGPLTNPAHASGQVVGVYALDMVEKLAERSACWDCIARWWCMVSMVSTRSPSPDQHAWPKTSRWNRADLRG